MEPVEKRFLRYVSYETTSDEFSETCPSTANQKVLAAAIVEEMLSMGIQDARMDENGYVYGTVPVPAQGSTSGTNFPVLSTKFTNVIPFCFATKLSSSPYAGAI